MKGNDLVNLSIREVVLQCKSSESNRAEDMGVDYRERAVHIGFRTTITGMEVATDDLRRRLDIGTRTLHRCMSHHMNAYFASLPEITEACKLTGEIKGLAVRHGFPHIATWPEKIGLFAPRNWCQASSRSGNSSVATIGWFKGHLGELSECLGIPTSTLFFIGAAWSVSTDSDSAASGVASDYLKPEVLNFEEWLDDRIQLLRVYKEILNGKIAKKEQTTDTNGVVLQQNNRM